VIVEPPAGWITSSNAVSVEYNPVAPFFTSQPASQIVLAGTTATFAAVAGGTVPSTITGTKTVLRFPARHVDVESHERVSASNGSYTLTVFEQCRHGDGAILPC
jgi:hypothetical protein